MSGIYIPDMKMPTACADCLLCCDIYYCRALECYLHSPDCYRHRLPNCPLVEVQSNGRLIDADALERLFKERKKPTLSSGANGSKERIRFLDWISTLQTIRDAPTIISENKADRGW